MAIARDFQSLGISVFTSQESESLISKQPVLSEHGSSVRETLRMLPPEVTREILSGYAPTPPALLNTIGEAIIAREFVIDSVEQGANLDKNWASAVDGEATSGLDDIDPWNAPERP